MIERTHFHRTPDGLRLFARDFGPENSHRVPLLCLAGLTRNSRDFLPLADKLGADRRLLCPDYRGRGRSQYASDVSTYTPVQELADVLALLDHLLVEKAVVIGTSRGGIIAMLMAQRAPERLEGAVLNDIGPRLEKEGLLRIARHLGVSPRLDSWDDAVEALKATNSGFEALRPQQWLDFAKRVFRDEDGRPKLDYDAGLAKAFPTPAKIAEAALPDMWEAYSALRQVPVAVLRAEHSDLLSADTVEHMKQLHPSLIAVTVADRGHVPFLDEPESVAAINRVLARCDSQTAGV